MPEKVGALVFPSVQTTPNRINDQTALPAQAESIVERNRQKHGLASDLPPRRNNPGASSSLPPRNAVFSSGPLGNTNQAFQALKTAGPQNFEKLYVVAHGGPEGVEKPKLGPTGAVEDFKAPELVANFMNEGGMRNAINASMEQAMRKPEGGRAEFKTSIRLLSCETGAKQDNPQDLFSTRTADSYARDVINQFGKQIGDVLGQLERTDPQGYAKANLSVEITVAAPIGWNLNMPDGKTVVYHSDSASEKAADKAAEIAYGQSKTKAEMLRNEKIAPYLVPDHEKKAVLTVRVDKYPGMKPMYSII